MDSIQFKIYHELFIVYSHSDVHEIFAFAINEDKPSIFEFYLNNLDLFEKFALHFHEKGKHLINKLDEQKLELIAPENAYLSPSSKKPLPRVTIIGYKGETYLTEREYQTLLCITQLETAKEIANKMNVSTRTIEMHIQNIKAKLGCCTKKQLREIFSANQMSFSKMS